MIKSEQATLLYTEEICSTGKIANITPDKPLTITAWDYFGVAGFNFIHPGIDECDRLMTIITPEQMEGIVLAFPSWDSDEFFETSGFLIFTECDTSFDISDCESVKVLEDHVNENFIPLLSQHPLIESIESKFKLKSHSIIKAFDKYWTGSLFVAKPFLKKLEKNLKKKNILRDFTNLKTIDEVVKKH